MNIKEKDLYEQIEKTGPFANNTFYYEIPIDDWSRCRKKIDMVTSKKEKLVAIEVKVSDWRKVLHQAQSNLYVLDYSYAAIWHKTIPNVDIDIFKKLGIGVLEISDHCKEIVKAKKSKVVIKERRKYAKDKCFNKEIKNSI